MRSLKTESIYRHHFCKEKVLLGVVMHASNLKASKDCDSLYQNTAIPQANINREDAFRQQE